MAIKDDNKRNEYTTHLFDLEATKSELSVKDIHALFLRVCGTSSQTTATSKELLEMRKRPEESHSDFGSRITLQVQCTGTDDKTPPNISHLFSVASPLARTDLKLWLLLKGLYDHLELPLLEARFTSLDDLSKAYQFLESPTSESLDSSSSLSNKNRSRSDNHRGRSNNNSNSRKRSASPSHGFKKSKDASSGTTDSKRIKPQLKCDNCPTLHNHQIFSSFESNRI
jgi:hypothetical protein